MAVAKDIRIPDGDASETPSSPHSSQSWDEESEEDDVAFPLFRDRDPNTFNIDKRPSFQSKADKVNPYGTSYVSGVGRVQENPTIRLKVAMEMSAALPTAVMNVGQRDRSICSRLCHGRHAQALPETMGHSIFICVLISYIVCIIMQLMFLQHAPVPFHFLDSFEDVQEWPLLPREFLKRQVSANYEIPKDQLVMSPIPIYAQYCNFNKGADAMDQAPDTMNFHVNLWMNEPKLSRRADMGGYQSSSVFPVLMASADWDTWWIVADRNQTFPRPYFRSHVARQEFRYVTPPCTRQPRVAKGGKDLALDVERFATHGTYLTACAVWDPIKIAWHRNSSNLTKEEIALYCDAFGGLAGKPCHFGASEDDLTLHGHRENVFLSTPTMAPQAVRFKGANFSGSIKLSECTWVASGSRSSCQGGNARFSEWECHKCMDDSVEFVGQWPYMGPWDKFYWNITSTLPPSSIYIYKSFPQFDVTLRDPYNVTRQPHVYILTASMPAENELHTLDGPWVKLYNEQQVHRPGWPQKDTDPAKSLETMANMWTEPTPFEVGVLDEDESQMFLHELNKVTIKPTTVFGPRGKLYIAACIVNRTTYDNKYNFTLGQLVRGPPFNDRCIAVTGRCALACTGVKDYSNIRNCDANGNIINLVQRIEPPYNDSMLVRLLMITMMISFGVKLITYIPGLFQPYPHCGKYNHVMTQMLGYLAVAVPTNGESKATVIRNVIGAVSTLPKHCSCRYHVLLIDEGHRKCLMVCWQKFCRILELLLLFGVSEEDDGNHVYISGAEDMLLDSTQRARSTVILKLFFKFWTEDTRKTTLRQLEKKPAPDEAILKKVAGLNALKRTKEETGMEDGDWNKLEKLCNILLADMKVSKTIVQCIHQDVRADWPPGEIHIPDDDSQISEVFFHGIGVDMGWRSTESGPILLQLPLRLHYLARSRPPEDERTIKVQEVAPGTWSYVLPEDSAWQDWLDLRRNAAPYESGLETALMPDENFVPLWTSRGKAGGLNFALNYLHWYGGMLDEALRDEQAGLRDSNRRSIHTLTSSQFSSHFGYTDPGENDVPSTTQHCLFSICDARHQYQPDFMHRVIPYFFKPGKRMFELDTSVSFCQSPQYFPEIQSNLDFLDNNNAQFFRLNCMLRNCCGGVSSCGTNGTWLVPPRDTGEMWAKPSRVIGSVASRQMHEFTFFHECCKIEDTASSLEQVLKGKRSQYSNYRLSYGLAKNPVDYLAAVQRWAEGGVVLSLQTFTLHLEQNNRFVFMFGACYLFLMSCLLRGLMIDSKEYTQAFLFKHWVPGWDEFWKPFYKSSLEWIAIRFDDYTDVEMDIHVRNLVNSTTVIAALVTQFLALWLLTEISGFAKRLCHVRFFPTGGRWWGRLMISFDNLTYFLWFWTGLFWIIFNAINVFVKKNFFFDPGLMSVFAFAGQLLGWSLILSATARNSKHEMLEANEVASIGVENVWRGTQLFYMTIPLTIYSILMGIADFLKWKHFNQDISFWTGGDRGAATKNMVKWWCIFLLSLAIFAWIWFLAGYAPDGKNDGAAASVYVTTLIALDVLHPCSYLWLGDPQFAPEAETKRIKGYTKWHQYIRDEAWWRRKIYYIVCAGCVVSTVKWLGPLNQVVMPFLLIFLPSLGLNQAFTSLISAPRA